MKKIIILILSLVTCIAIESSLQAATEPRPELIELTQDQSKAAIAIATAIHENDVKTVEEAINSAFTQDILQNPELATNLALSLFRNIGITLSELGKGAEFKSLFQNDAGYKFNELLWQPYLAKYYSPRPPAVPAPEIQLLTNDQLPKLTKDELINEINKTKEILPGYFIEALTVSNDYKIAVIGDIHGGSDELVATINKMRNNGYFRPDDPWKLQDKCVLILTGDYADRGPDGLGVWRIVMKLAQNNPERCLLLRGNHETFEMSASYGFKDELDSKYSDDKDDEILKSFDTLFEKLPSALFLSFKQPDTPARFGIYCHGGLDPRISPDSIKNLIAQSIGQQNTFIGKKLDEIKIDKIDDSKFDPRSSGLLWSDFKKGVRKSDNFELNAARGDVGYTIYPADARLILNAYSNDKAKVDYIVRAHLHREECISVFVPQEESDLTLQSNIGLKELVSLLHRASITWEPLTSKQLITPYSIFTFMCLKPGLPNMPKETQAGFGEIKLDQNHQLTIEPHIAIDYAKK